MKKETSSSKSTAPLLPEKVRTPEEIREWIRTLHSTVEPDQTLIEADKALKKNVGDKLTKETENKLETAMLVLGHERHYLVAESVGDERWRPMVIDLAQSIQKEYQCTTPSEIALAGLAASAYYRSLRAARKVNGLLGMDAMGPGAITLVSHASKEVERAEREYITAIETLRIRRQPQVDVRIQTKTAFFAQNQNINANTSPSEPSDSSSINVDQ